MEASHPLGLPPRLGRKGAAPLDSGAPQLPSTFERCGSLSLRHARGYILASVRPEKGSRVKAVVVYQSLWGSTAAVARAIARRAR